MGAKGCKYLTNCIRNKSRLDEYIRCTLEDGAMKCYTAPFRNASLALPFNNVRCKEGAGWFWRVGTWLLHGS